MRVHTLSYATIFDAPLEQVYLFHTDTTNLPKITPPWIDVRLVEKEDDTVSLVIKRFGIPTRWKMLITQQYPHLVMDEMVEGPFTWFRHERRFFALNKNQTRMHEMISFVLPFGLLGNLLFPFIKADMDKMFDYRHVMSQKIFKESSLA